MSRRRTRALYVGKVGVGGAHPVSVQSMTNTDTRNVPATLAQIRALAAAGCELVRVAAPDMDAALCLGELVRSSPLPVVADIHFDYRLAVESVRQGVHGLRLNPGNIGARRNVEEVVRAASERRVPIRIGVNAGSLEKEILARYGGVTPEAMAESALNHIRILEDLYYDQIKISLKASSVPLMVQACRLMADKTDYPLHLGVTEAGLPGAGAVKSALGIGILLAEGVGDTIRVSLTGDPLEEIPVAKQILRNLGLRGGGAEIVSCPTCGRCQVDLPALVREIQARIHAMPELARLEGPEAPAGDGRGVTVAVMGCAVNGPGEARAADVGVAGGKGEGVIFVRGEVREKAPEDRIVDVLMRFVEEYLARETAAGGGE
ncbi:MAG: flavodoxin-dependent (E)-4-hydroxy-3-methylbut-2-enyl-diphosphate synthase [Peptococcaceae bacterium]|nr:flavodoxin-dependent (E)-4-hydroxy-3-methylbut-2-enyl-diphosphate synthase [Peptococcaceae bacterium]